MIIGLTGGYASGKDIIAEYLVKKHGFNRYSLSEIIRESLEEDKKEITRDALIKRGNFLREKFGAWILAKMISDKIDKNKNYVIVSFRNPSEVRYFKKFYDDFFLAEVRAPADLRYARAKERFREKEHVKSLDAFIKSENKEMHSNNPDSQQLRKVFELASIVVKNDVLRNELYRKVDRMYFDIRDKLNKKFRKKRK